MDHFQVAFRFNECRSLRGLEDVVCLAQMLPGCGFLPAEPPNDPKPSHDIEVLVRRQWKPDPSFRPEKPFDGFSQYWVFFRIIPVQSPEVLSTFSCRFYSLEHSTVTLGGLVHFEPQGQALNLESYAQNLLELALRLYPQLSPNFGWVDEDESYGRHAEETVAMNLKIIGWANFFGPPFVEKYGREFLMGLPGWKVEELNDGGVFHQLAPSILASDQQGVQQLQKQVVEYCRQAGQRVQCRAPYVLQPLEHTGQEAELDEGYGTNEELKEYLEQILSTTLTLKDGTRVKPIYIEWVLLTPEQRQIVLSSIKQAAISEIRQHRSARIRFEFNEIPADLDHMMRDLVGVNNPDFMYVQVDMN
jgi:hypothetical protein